MVNENYLSLSQSSTGHRSHVPEVYSALSVGPQAWNWLASSHQPRLLHAFESVCNLINERGEVLSIVTREIGNGPFNLVIESGFLLPERITALSPVSLQAGLIRIAGLGINFNRAQSWSATPDWTALHRSRQKIRQQLASRMDCPDPTLSLHPFVTSFSNIASGISRRMELAEAILNDDLDRIRRATHQLAGLGAGLTPAGDDILMGAIYATYIIYPIDHAERIATVIASEAIFMTTSLSAAWLRAAARGQAGIRWHDLFKTLLLGDELDIRGSLGRILSIGSSSGSDALAGFLYVLGSLKIN